MDEYSDTHTASIAPLLAAFDAAATEGHITRASEVLGVPQSSVSRRLKALERVLGIPLFQPVGRGVSLTASGRELFERTHHAVRTLDDAVAVVRANADPDSGLVRFGFPLTIGPQSVSSLLADFHVCVPRIRVHLVQAHGEALAEMIRDGRLDIAVLIPPPDDLDSIVLGSQTIRLHVASTHRLARRKEVSIEELADESFVASPPTFHLRTLLDAWCMDAGFAPRVPFEINEIETIRALVGAGLGIALLPGRESTDPRSVAIPLRDRRTRDIGLASGRHRPTAAVTRFHSHVMDHMGR